METDPSCPACCLGGMTCTLETSADICVCTEDVGLILDGKQACIVVLAFPLSCATIGHLSMFKQLGIGA